MGKTYNIFVSHSWAYSDAYTKLLKLLNNDPYFSYRNYSVPKDDPIHNAPTDKQLYEAIKRQVNGCHVVLIMAGVYSSYSKWIDKEIDIAKNGFLLSKPIIAIEPWASTRTSQKVKQNADIIVRWNSNSIIKAIKELG
ncbi:TPA: molecular chaperone Tir [Salmonella enterica subsp. enterica serovar Typhimurium var. 5-]|uniref:Molecular chaperone Tir n=1 Tax=Salmonella enterica subsp. enterica serovar Typhimurium var. 5- TaxID=1620419 RepID=A0A740PV74_SALTM|nr:molecular chaperone Tir [Salmonella enterica subsp. enterica serovar Typhimurium var. 5-]